MFRYLRIQATTQTTNYAQLMLDHGAFTFVPGAHVHPPLPRQVDPSIAAVLAHDEIDT